VIGLAAINRERTMDQVMVGNETQADTLAPLKVKVNVHAIWDRDLDTILFALGGDVEDKKVGEKVNAHAIITRAGPRGIIRFRLIDETGLNLKFSSSPFSVQEGLECPDERSETWSAQVDDSMMAGGSLDVENPGRRGVYTYSLFFDGQDGSTYECDPIIKNIA
jgi:hypothetical protein